MLHVMYVSCVLYEGDNGRVNMCCIMHVCAMVWYTVVMHLMYVEWMMHAFMYVCMYCMVSMYVIYVCMYNMYYLRMHLCIYVCILYI